MPTEQYKIILDLPSQDPALAFDQQANAFKDIVERSRPQFAIGIFGGWGSGKTTLMQAIDARLDSDRAITVWFSAWRYEKEEHLIVPLLDEVRQSLMSWAAHHPDRLEAARKTATTIGKAMTSLLAGISFKMGVPGAMELSLSANESLAEARRLGEEERDSKLPQSFYHASFRALSDAFGEFVAEDPSRRIVVFIDDLDRCLPEGALEVLESMKLFFDLPGFVFVVGLDQSVVEWLIDAKYGRTASAVTGEERSAYQIRGSDYIKKIFQVPFTLAPVAINQLPTFLSSLYDESELSVEQRQDLKSRLEPHLRYVVTDSGVNPREIKRYINAYTIAIKVKPHLDKDTVLALLTLNFRPDWQLARTALYTYREVFVDALAREVAGDPNSLENLDSQLAAIPQAFKTYVSAEAPGHSLLQTSPLDEYIYTGEATSSTQDPKLLDSLRRLGEAKQLLRSVEQIRDPDESNRQFRRLEGIVTETIGAVESYARGPIAPAIVQEGRTLESRLKYAPDPRESESFERWLQQQRQSLEEMQRLLLSLYQYSSLGP